MFLFRVSFLCWHSVLMKFVVARLQWALFLKLLLCANADVRFVGHHGFYISKLRTARKTICTKAYDIQGTTTVCRTNKKCKKKKQQQRDDRSTKQIIANVDLEKRRQKQKQKTNAV